MCKDTFNKKTARKYALNYLLPYIDPSLIIEAAEFDYGPLSDKDKARIEAEAIKISDIMWNKFFNIADDIPLTPEELDELSD